jgi:hypothetical protein
MVIGTVYSFNGATLPFASVYVSNGQGAITSEATGAVANDDGNYQINAEPGQYLTASFVGYLKQTKPVMEDDGILSFALDADTLLPEATIVAAKPTNWKLIIAAIIIAALILYYLNK